MNSVEGLRGFITFLILSGMLLTGVIGFNFISQPTNTVSEADESKVDPLNVTVQNITESSADVSWASIEPASTKIIYTTNMDATCLTDTNSLETCISVEATNNQTSHLKTLNNLTPETTYFFKIMSNGKLYPESSSHTFRTTKALTEPTPVLNTTPEASQSEDFDGFGEVDITEPSVNQLNNVLGVQDENLEGVEEPSDPLGNIDKLMQEEFNEALKFNDLRFDFNKDGEVTLADYPLFINFVLSE